MSDIKNTETEPDQKSRTDHRVNRDLFDKAAIGVAAITAIAAFVVAILVGYFTPKIEDQLDMAVTDQFEKLIDKTRSDLTGELAHLSSQLSSQLAALVELPDDAALSLKLANLQGTLGQLDNRLTSLEEALGSSPSKSLAVPLLRKDIELLQESQDDILAAAGREIQRVYDLNKWFLGLIATMAVGVLGLALSNFRKSQRDAE